MVCLARLASHGLGGPKGGVAITQIPACHRPRTSIEFVDERNSSGNVEIDHLLVRQAVEVLYQGSE